MTNTSRTIIELMSRDEAGDAWIHLLPTGTFAGRDGRGPYKLHDANAVINASREQAGRIKMPIDYNHAIDLAANKGGESPAAGWINALHSRQDGIWGRVEWTPRAAEHLRHREYRYLSPVFGHSIDGSVTALLRASLTNTPNLDQLTELASMETSKMDKLESALPELRKSLSLADDADVTAILQRVDEIVKIKNTLTLASSSPDPAKFVPIGEFERVVAKVHELDKGISLQSATLHVQDKIERGHLLPSLREWGVSLCSVNKAAFDKFVENTKGGLQALLTSAVPSLLPDNLAIHAAADADEISIANNLSIKPEDLVKTKNARMARE